MDNALFATQNVFIPALAESTSKRAFELLYDHIEALERDYEITIRDHFSEIAADLDDQFGGGLDG